MAYFCIKYDRCVDHENSSIEPPEMLKVALLICLVGIALAAPAREQVPLIQDNFTRDDHGQYSYNFLTGDGVARTEQGSLVPNADRTGNVLVQKGGYRYYLPTGELVEVNYIADENGFRATGTHIPVAPAVPTV